MTRTMPMIEARNKLTTLPEHFARERDLAAVAVTRRGKPVLALMSWDFYESIVETMEIMGDEKMMGALREGIREAAKGRSIPWETAKRKLKL